MTKLLQVKLLQMLDCEDVIGIIKQRFYSKYVPKKSPELKL